MALLIITSGLMGSGKSSIIQGFVSNNPRYKLIVSDIIRKKLAGINETEHAYESFNCGIYSPEFTKKTYRYLISLAEGYLKEGIDVIIDATFTKKWQRKLALECAIRTGSDFICLEFRARDKVLLERLENRYKNGNSVSDGRPEIFKKQKESFDKIVEAEFHIDTHETKDKKSINIIYRIINTEKPIEENIKYISSLIEELRKAT